MDCSRAACGLAQVRVQCRIKNSDPTLNPHWQLTKEFTSHPFQFLQIIRKHFLKRIKGRKSLIYRHEHSRPPLLSCFFPFPSFA